MISSKNIRKGKISSKSVVKQICMMRFSIVHFLQVDGKIFLSQKNK
jgi:hypothetical protein